MSAEYVIWMYKPVKDAAILTDLQGLDRKFRLTDGTPLAAGFPGDVSLRFHPDFPTDMTLIDNVRNTSSLALVSARLAEAIKDAAPACVEFLPVSLLDHKGRLASKDYSIVHPVDPVDCIDREQSVFEESLIAKGDIEFFDRLVLDEERIADRKLFRLKGFADIILVHRELAQGLEAKEFLGLRWLPVDEYPEE